MASSKQTLEQNLKFLGYGYIKNVEDLVPHVGLTFYSFHVMVALGTYFIALFALTLFMCLSSKLTS